MQRSDEQKENFVRLLIEAQGSLYAFILTLLANADTAKDVLQETNLVLWRKNEEFEAGTHFFAWARRIAEFQVMA